MNHHAKFEIDRTILTCLKKLTILDGPTLIMEKHRLQNLAPKEILLKGCIYNKLYDELVFKSVGNKFKEKERLFKMTT